MFASVLRFNPGVMHQAKKFVQGETVNGEYTGKRFQSDIRLSFLDSPILDFGKVVVLSECLDGGEAFFCPQVSKQMSDIGKCRLE